MIMYDYVLLCMIMYDYVWLCMIMYDYVWLCMHVYYTLHVMTLPTWDFSSPESLPSGSAAPRFATSSRPFRWCDDQGRVPTMAMAAMAAMGQVIRYPGNRKLMVNIG